MPQRYSAKKAARQDQAKHARNLKIKAQIKKAIKQLKQLIVEKKSDEAKKLLPKVNSLLDKAAKKNVIKVNTARRKVSRLQLALQKT
jgi:small subunit ribosomal protein S20